MEQRQPDPGSAGLADEGLLGAVEQPVRREEAGLLVRVGVAEHDLLTIPAADEMATVGAVGEQAAEDLTGGLQRVGRFEERHDVERGCRRREPGRRARGDFGGSRKRAELEDCEHVADSPREADDVAVAGRLAEPILDRRHRPERREHLRGRNPRRRRVLGVQSPGSRVGERRRMDLGVLADLE